MTLGPEHVEAVERAADKIHSAAVLLTSGQSAAGNTGTATITVNMGGWGVIVAAAACAIAVVAVVLQQDRINDYTNEMRSHYAEQREWQAWSREESNIWRGYVWQGKVPPINPAPKGVEKPNE